MSQKYLFRLRNCLFHRNGLGDVFGTIPSSLVQFKGESTWTDRNRILFKPNSRKTQCLPRWRFGRNFGECLQEIHFGKVAICRRPWQNHRSRAFPNFKTWGISKWPVFSIPSTIFFIWPYDQRYSMVGETFCVSYIMHLWIILFKAYENAHLLYASYFSSLFWEALG